MLLNIKPCPVCSKTCIDKAYLQQAQELVYICNCLALHLSIFSPFWVYYYYLQIIKCWLQRKQAYRLYLLFQPKALDVPSLRLRTLTTLGHKWCWSFTTKNRKANFELCKKEKVKVLPPETSWVGSVISRVTRTGGASAFYWKIKMWVNLLWWI